MSREDVGIMIWHFDPTNHRYKKRELEAMARALGIPTTYRTISDLISQIDRKRRHVEIEDEDEILEEKGEHHQTNFHHNLIFIIQQQ